MHFVNDTKTRLQLVERKNTFPVFFPLLCIISETCLSDLSPVGCDGGEEDS